MNAIKKVQRYIQTHPGSSASALLVQLAEHLAEERAFPVAKLYEMEMEAFELAVALLRDWRLDRYYTGRLHLLEAIGPAPVDVRQSQPARSSAVREDDATLEAA